MFNQENFVLKGNSYKIRKALTNFHVLIKPAFKDSFEKGRPRNGMFIAIPQYLKNNLEDVSPQHWRIQAAVFTCESYKLLFINSYFPVDDRHTLNRNVNELVETLEVVKNVIEKNPCDHLLFLGDLNAEFLRNSPHCQNIRSFVHNSDLQHSWSILTLILLIIKK